MADENQDLQQQMAALRAAMQGLESETKNAQVGVKAFGAAAAKAPGEFAKGVGNFTRTVAQGDTQFKALNTIVDGATNAIAGMAKAIPFAGEAIAAGLRAAADASKFMIDQIDQTTKSFNELSRAGALTADGMTGLQRQFLASGLTLQQFQKQISANSQALARFRGMTGEGAEDFSKIVGSLTQGADDSLRRLGLSAEDIGESTAAYVTQQARLGRAQNATNEQLAAGTKAYAIELDALQKATGLSREAIQKQQDAMLSESRFRASLTLVNEKFQQSILNFTTAMGSFGPTTKKGVQDLLSGVPDSKEAIATIQATGGRALDIVNRLKEGQITEQQAQLEMRDAVKENIGQFTQYSSVVQDGTNVLGNYAEFADIAASKIGESGNLIARTQKAQMAGGDALTDTTVQAQKDLQKMNIEINKLGFTFLPAASEAVASFSKVMKELVEYINEKILGKKGEGRPLPGRAVSGGGQTSAAEMGGAGGGGAEAAAPASASEIAAARQSVFGGGGGGGPPQVSAKDYIKFTGGTGSEAHFDKLDPGVRSQFLQMAVAYNQLTGKQLQVNSAFRSPEEQAAVNPGTNPKAAPGMSLHNVGRALDIQSDQRQFLESNGLLAQYGFKPLAGDPPHISAASGAILSGPTSGYRPNLTMHGTEAIVPLNSGSAASSALGFDPGIMSEQLNRLDELVSVMKNQVSISSKLLTMAS